MLTLRDFKSLSRFVTVRVLFIIYAITGGTDKIELPIYMVVILQGTSRTQVQSAREGEGLAAVALVGARIHRAAGGTHPKRARRRDGIADTLPYRTISTVFCQPLSL